MVQVMHIHPQSRIRCCITPRRTRAGPAHSPFCGTPPEDKPAHNSSLEEPCFPPTSRSSFLGQKLGLESMCAGQASRIVLNVY